LDEEEEGESIFIFRSREGGIFFGREEKEELKSS
jgi:hypothetical protein